MVSLRDIKNRKEAVTTIRKITKAMELVATSKIRHAKSNLEKIQQYTNRIEEIFNNLSSQIKDVESIIKIDESNPKIFIVVTSDIGMCGSYNSNIIRLAKSNIKKEDYLVLIGSKGVKILSNYFSNKQILTKIETTSDNVSYDIVEKTLDKIVPLIFLNKISSINIISTKFINTITYEATDKKIFPIMNDNSTKNKISSNVEFEPDVETVIKKTIPLYIGSIIYNSLANSKVSEMLSRRMAMESASDNALDIINDLVKQYNRVRQSKITQEINEIVAGAQDE